MKTRLDVMEWSFAAVLPGCRFKQLESVLLELTRSPVIVNDCDFEWRGPGMDLNLRFVEDEYLGTGYMSCSQQEAVAWCRILAYALERAGIKYKIELFTTEVDGPVFEWGED